MAIRLEDIPEKNVFGRRLFKLAEERGYRGPAAIARDLYDKCFEILYPDKFKSPKKEEKAKKIAAIAKNVQRQFDPSYCKHETQVDGKYMMAYSILFNCSLDFLYGKIDQKYPNAEIKDICEKTGLSATAVEKLISKKRINLDEHLRTIYEDTVSDASCEAKSDENPKCFYMKMSDSVSDFWSTLIESEMFSELPKLWYQMAEAQYKKNNAERETKDYGTVEENEEFKELLERFDTQFDTGFPIKTVSILNNLYQADIEKFCQYMCTQDSHFVETYYKDPEASKEKINDLIRYTHYIYLREQLNDCQLAYWGHAKTFEKKVLEFFQKITDAWCESCPGPSLPSQSAAENTISVFQL